MSLPAVPEHHLAPAPSLPARPEEDSDAPQWVIAGFQTPTGVLILASTTLSGADFRRMMNGYDEVPVTPNPRGPVAKVPRWIIALNCTMHDFVQIRGDTYPAAMRTLMEMWDPSRRTGG